MTEHLPPEPDDIVGQVVERAATKVAEASNSAMTVTPPVFSRIESWVIVAVIMIALVANLILNVQTKNVAAENQGKIEAACKLAALSQGAQQAPTGAVRLAECLK